MIDMKKFLMAAAVLGGFSAQAMAEAVGDTLVIEQAEKVRIETRDTVQRIVISGAKDDPDFHYVQRISIPDTSAVRRTVKSVKDFNKITVKRNGKEGKVDFGFHLNLGLGTMVNADAGSFKMQSSWDYGLTFMVGWHPYGKRNVWSAGLGVNRRNYKMDRDQFWFKDSYSDVISPVDVEPNWSNCSALLSVFSLQVPLTYTHYFDNKAGWGLTVGGIINFNTGAHATRRYTTSGTYSNSYGVNGHSSNQLPEEDYKVTTKAIGQRLVTVDALAIVHIPSFLDVYCKYCPMKFFKDDRGPKMQQLSIGFMF